MKRLALAGLLVAATACAGLAGDCDPADPDGAVPFHLYVSNQSFEIDPVDIVVWIDDQQVVCDRFHVEGQHNWVLFDLGLEPGPHSLRAVGNGGKTMFEQEFDLPAERWAVLDFWYYPDDEPEKLTFSIHDGPVGFD